MRSVCPFRRSRISSKQDLVEAAFRLTELTQDPTRGREWGEGLYREISKLATTPRAYAMAELETRRFRQQTRQMLYRRTAFSAAYRVLYTVAEEGPDGPAVTIIHIRHASRKPLTREEARRILANQ